jgi:hypothetical protein
LDDRNKELLKIWKNKGDELLEKAIKNIYSLDKSKTVEELLTV